MKRIVMMRGGVETLDYFGAQMAETLRARGYPVFFHDLEDPIRSAKKLKKYMHPGETVLITFNFEGLEKERGVYEDGVGYLWDSYRVACYNIAVDHPYYYHERLRELPRDYHHISIDRNHERYFKKFYPEFDHVGFLPLAGNLPMQEQDKEETENNYKYRQIDVIFTGNYTELPFFEPYINWINEEYAAFYRGIIDELIRCPDETVEEVELAHCEREMGENTTEDLRQALYKMLFIDMYVRNYYRGLAVQTLADEGITVDVVGKGWEKLPLAHPEHLRIHEQTDSAACLAMMKQAKLSLNVMPWFKDGAHDRVFNSIANGTVSLSDTSKYLCEELSEGEGVCYYSLKEMKKLPGQVRALLSDCERLSQIAADGRTKVMEHHLWKNRADQMIAWIES